MKKIVFFITVVAFFTACDDDNISTQRKEMYEQLFVGEWVWPNSKETHFTDITLQSGKKALYAVYENKVGNTPASVEDNGSWWWYADRRIISFTFINDIPPFCETVDIDDSRLLLRNTRFNTTDTYYRVVETLNIDAGQTASIDYVKEHQASAHFATTNSGIVALSDDGTVEGLQEGVAFVEISTANAKVYAKVTVRGRPARFKEETHMLADEIKAKYGEPQYEGLQNNGQVVMQYLSEQTSDAALFVTQYWYHPITQEIYRIFTAYTSEENYLSDQQFITSKYYQQNDDSEIVYGEYQRYNANSYLIYLTGLSGGYFCILYLNTDYPYI